MKIVLIKTVKPFPVLHYSKIKKAILPISIPKTEILERMAMTCKIYDGIGLSATQVGISQKFFCLKVMENDAANEQYEFFFEPSWKFLSNEKIKDQEGCLSVPGLVYEVERYSKIQANFKTVALVDGKQCFVAESRVLTGLESVVFQHEWDHLQGVSIVQRGTKRFNP